MKQNVKNTISRPMELQYENWNPKKLEAFGFLRTGEHYTEILNLKMKPSDVKRLIDRICYFRAYHMNKKHWITIPLGHFLSTDEILKRIDDSFLLAGD